MGDLRNLQAIVNVAACQNTKGPSNKSARSEHSSFYHVGGSRNDYGVTINHEDGHFCLQHNGKPCQGNLTGIRAGKIHERDTMDPSHWCKHVKAVMRDAALMAEGKELSYAAFHPVSRKGPKANRVKAEVSGAATRLAALEAEAAKIRKEVADKVAALVAEYGIEEVRNAM